MLQEENTSTLSIVDSSGRQVSILNSTSSLQLESQPQALSPPLKQHPYHQQEVGVMNGSTAPVKRKYVCNEPGCFKSFSTSGHLTRHYRIHSGEKNFPCLYPMCRSKFSRQDNMMQHYRTHMSSKSRRPKKQSDDRSQPRLHAHNRIISDVTVPLTIDQHLHNYHQSRTYRQQQPRYQQEQQRHIPSYSRMGLENKDSTVSISTDRQGQHGNDMAFSKAPSVLSSVSTPSPQSLPSSSSAVQLTISNRTTHKHVKISSITPAAAGDTFYQHRPLIYTECQDTNPTTLLNPTPIDNRRQTLSSTLEPASTPPYSSKAENDSTSNSLIQLANIVSSFG